MCVGYVVCDVDIVIDVSEQRRCNSREEGAIVRERGGGLILLFILL